MCRSSDYPPYDSDTIETFDGEDEDAEVRCPNCGRLFLHKTTCPSYENSESRTTDIPGK